MRIYKDDKGTELMSVVCNKCSNNLKVENGIVKEGCFRVQYEFGYFSKKDGEIQKFDLCESCYDKLVANFIIPVEKQDAKELL